MEITFKGHAPQERTVEVTEGDLSLLQEMLVSAFLTHVEFANLESTYLVENDKKILKFCERYGVDGLYTKDRLAFFKALLKRDN